MNDKKTLMELSGLYDENHTPIPLESIIAGPDPEKKGLHFFNFGKSTNGDHLDMVACTYGYVEHVTQDDLKGFLYVGPTEDFKDLLNCD